MYTHYRASRYLNWQEVLQHEHVLKCLSYVLVATEVIIIILVTNYLLFLDHANCEMLLILFRRCQLEQNAPIHSVQNLLVYTSSNDSAVLLRIHTMLHIYHFVGRSLYPF